MNSEVALHNAFPENNDKITLRSAMKEPVWMMIYAAEPKRNIDVTMTYADLKVIYDMMHENPVEMIFKTMAKEKV